MVDALLAVLLAFAASGIIVISEDAHVTPDGQCVIRTTTYGHNNGDGTVTVTGSVRSLECP